MSRTLCNFDITAIMSPNDKIDVLAALPGGRSFNIVVSVGARLLEAATFLLTLTWVSPPLSDILVHVYALRKRFILSLSRTASDSRSMHKFSRAGQNDPLLTVDCKCSYAFSTKQCFCAGIQELGRLSI